MTSATMTDGSENDESTKLNSVDEEDVDRSEFTPLSLLSNMEEEEEEYDDDDDEEEYEEDEDEEEDEEEEEEEEEEEKVNDGEKAMVVVNNEELNANKVEDETKTENAGKEDANKGKDEEKPEEPKTGEELGENLKRKRSRPRNRNKRKDVQKESATLAANGDKPESSSKNNDAQKSFVTLPANGDKPESSNRKKGANGDKPESSSKNNDAQKSSVTLPANGDKPESSNRKKGPKRVESMGMVFMCTSKTKTDCFRYKILGLPGNKKDQVAKIYKGMRLFLFDVDLRLMYGIFKAAGAGGFNLEPKAFNTDFPSQVRFTVMEDCLPLAEEKFKGVLKENYYSRNKFEGLLKAEQVRKLCKLFVEMGRAGGSRPKAAIKSRRTRPVENRRIRGDVSHRSRVDDGPRSSRPLEKRKRPLRLREEERTRPHSPPRREKRRNTDYERERERERPVLYERETERPVVYERGREREQQVVYERERERERPISYERERERERPISYERERERERPILYEREPVSRYLAPLPPPSAVSPVRMYAYERQPLDIPPYVRERIPDHQAYRIVDERERDPYYSREAPTYREPVYTLPPEYHIVGREYHPPALHTQPEYRLSSGSRLPSYRDELAPPDYRSSAPTLPDYHPRTHYRY